MAEDSSSDDEDEDGEEGEPEIDEDSQGQVYVPNKKAGKDQGSDSGSFCSDIDILNKDLSEDCEDSALDSSNYLRYVSEKHAQKFNILEIVDKNERSFKQVAERMIQQSSQLEVQDEPIVPPPGMNQDNQYQQTRRLTLDKTFKNIADRFHGDVQIAQGVPYSIAALEDFIAIGSSDGSVRLFDHSEQEIKNLNDKSVRANATTCIDIKRIGPQKNIYIVSGHMKGHLALYEIRGLLE